MTKLNNKISVQDEAHIETNQMINNQSKQFLMLNLRHLGTNLSNLSIFCVSFVILLLLGQILTLFVGFFAAAILFCFLVVVTVLTLGTIYIGTDFGKMWGWFGAITSGSADFIEFLQKITMSIPYVSIVAILAAMGSIISFSYSKKYRSLSRIIISSIVIALSLISLILYFVGAIQ